MDRFVFRYIYYLLLAAASLLPHAYAYFKVTAPVQGTQWVNGQTYPMSWIKGVMDGVDTFDIELSRLSKGGLMFVAKDVPSVTGTINLAIQDVPPADDYFLLFLNSTHGVMYGNSPQFSILDSSSTANSSNPSPESAKPTVTLSGGPNPTAVFATTFPPSVNGVVGGWDAMRGWTSLVLGLLSIVTLGVASGALTVL
ncbi:hypothetical protein EVG20_g6429 [Dentipellis fragilis]|uniref:Uncharacterized protein n=1 Tax=Dentipellis fragilis TaxID=205917 RepID=A0A4Y9YQ48_9AGAM|nr:hypothetical protein EVG20_g6429 [Dentipellis fragilis]